MMLDRNEDMMITGGRHPYLSKYKVSSNLLCHFSVKLCILHIQVGFTNDGRLLALDIKYYCGSGNTVDISVFVG